MTVPPVPGSSGKEGRLVPGVHHGGTLVLVEGEEYVVSTEQREADLAAIHREIRRLTALADALTPPRPTSAA